MKQLPLTKIGFFNPGRLTDEEIEQSFISRIPFFEYLFKKIIDEPANSIPQHYLIIGQRGMGKTSLLVRIAAELRKNPYNKTFIPLTFPEEQYNIDRLSKFWLNCLDALADALDKENNKKELAALDAEISAISKEANLDANVVYTKFKIWTNAIKRRPVLLVDNLNLIFEKINKEEQHQLRAILISNDSPILIGASATSIDETINYGAPFYDGFQISYLKKLTFRESLDVLQNLAKITGNENFETIFIKQKGRLEALYQLTGGTPRTLAILFPLIQDGFSEGIQTDLDALLDAITPLYKARFDELAPQLQVVMDAVALNWDPINLERLREVTQLENAQLSPQLKRLIDVGWLQKLDAYKAKGGAYELSERFFNVWYLMRRSSRRQKRELYCLTKFLESFYGNDIHKIAKNRITCKSENINHITFDLALADAIGENKLSNRLRNKSYEALIELSVDDIEILKVFQIPSNVSKKKVSKLLEETNLFYKKQEFSNVEKSLLRVLKIDERHLPSWQKLGELYQNHLEKYTDAEIAYREVLKLDKNHAVVWNNLADLYQYNLERYNEAEIAYKESIKSDGKFARPWNGLANLYQYNFRKYDEAQTAYKKAIKLNEKFANAWHNLGNLYVNHLKNYNDAEKAYKKAIEIDEKSIFSINYLGNLYQFYMERYEEAETEYIKAIEINSKFSPAWKNLANLYHDYLKNYEKAEKAYKRVIELEEKDSSFLNNLGNLYQDHLEKYNEAEAAYRKAIELNEKDAYPWNGLGNLYQYHLKKFIDAEIAYKKAISVDSKFAQPWNELGNLYQYRLEKYSEAESAYKKAIKLNETDASTWGNLGYLYHYFLGKIDEAESVYKRAIELNERDASNWVSLGNLYQDSLGKYLEAEFAIKRAIAIDGEDASYWNCLGHLYHMHLGKYQDAEMCYKKSIELESTESYPKYNLVSLWRDNMNQIEKAKQLFDQITLPEVISGSHLLYKSIFAFYDKNVGVAETLLREAFVEIGEKFPHDTQLDWYRSAAIIIKLGYGTNLLNVLSANDYNITMRPFYVAIEGLRNKEDLFLNSIAAEVRMPAKIIRGIMEDYIK